MDGSIPTVADAPWPGLTPDLLSVFLVTATQAKGEVLIHQKMFESRLFFVDKLIDMGAQIILRPAPCCGHLASGSRISSVLLRWLRPISVLVSPLLIAAMSAEGTSIINNIEQQIDRGYQDIAGRLNALGAHISSEHASKEDFEFVGTLWGVLTDQGEVSAKLSRRSLGVSWRG